MRTTRRLLLPAYLLFVIYGSLVPLDFRPLPLDDALRRFAQTPFLTLGAASRADWIANGVLYFPLGALTALTLIGWLPRLPWLAMVAAWACLHQRCRRSPLSWLTQTSGSSENGRGLSD